MYSHVLVSIFNTSPIFTNKGTCISNPVSNFAGFPDVVVVFPLKPGKGSAFVRTKLKNVITGATLEKTFNPSDKFPAAEIEKKTMQYLYNDGGLYYFMDNETYDQMPLNEDQLGDCLKYLKENMEVTIL